LSLLTKAQRHLLPQLRENFATYCKGGLFRAAESLVDKGYAKRSRYGDFSGGYYVRTVAGTELVRELGGGEATGS
jgi:hypothetical protein